MDAVYESARASLAAVPARLTEAVCDGPPVPLWAHAIDPDAPPRYAEEVERLWKQVRPGEAHNLLDQARLLLPPHHRLDHEFCMVDDRLHYRVSILPPQSDPHNSMIYWAILMCIVQ
jgi:hypothetical protein